MSKVWIIQPVFVSATCRAGHWDLSPDPSLYVHAVSTESALPPSTRAAQPHVDPGVCILFDYGINFWFISTKRAFWRFISPEHPAKTHHRTHTAFQHMETSEESSPCCRLDDPSPRDWEKFLHFTRIEYPAKFSSKHVLKQRWSFQHFFHHDISRWAKHSDCYVPVPLTIWSILGWMTAHTWEIGMDKLQVALLELVVGLLILRIYMDS